MACLNGGIFAGGWGFGLGGMHIHIYIFDRPIVCSLEQRQVRHVKYSACASRIALLLPLVLLLLLLLIISAPKQLKTLNKIKL